MTALAELMKRSCIVPTGMRDTALALKLEPKKGLGAAVVR